MGDFTCTTTDTAAGSHSGHWVSLSSGLQRTAQAALQHTMVRLLPSLSVSTECDTLTYGAQQMRPPRPPPRLAYTAAAMSPGTLGTPGFNNTPHQSTICWYLL
jgi:hypothetical protein